VEIHTGVCAIVGREVDRSALKSALSANILGKRPRFRRLRRASMTCC